MVGWTNADNKFGPSSYVVGTPANGLGNGVNYTSIQQAINDASIGTTIIIRPGTYTENITLKNGVFLWGVPSSGLLAPLVNVIGNLTLDASLSPGTLVHLENISFVSSAGNGLLTTNAGLVRFHAFNCYFQSNGGFAGALLQNVSGTYSLFEFKECLIIGDTIGLDAQNHNALIINESRIQGPIAMHTQDTARITAYTTQLTADTTAVVSSEFEMVLRDCYLEGNNCLGVQVLGTGDVIIESCVVNSTDASGFWASGDPTATMEYTNIVLEQNKDIDPTIVSGSYDWKPYAVATPSPGTGATKGTCNFDDSVFSVVDGFVSSLSGTGFIESVTSAGATIVPTAGNIQLQGESGVNVAQTAASIFVYRAPLYTTTSISGLMNADNAVFFTTNAITLSLPSTVQMGLCQGAVVTDAGPVVLTPSDPAQSIRIGALISSAGGTATSTSIGDELVLRLNTNDNIWYAEKVIGNWILA